MRFSDDPVWLCVQIFLMLGCLPIGVLLVQLTFDLLKAFWKTAAGVLLIVCAASGSAEACSRCGRSGCVYKQPVAVQPIVAPPVVNTYVINGGQYPAPLVAGGSTAYQSLGSSYQATTLPLFDPQQYLSQSLELQKAVNGTLGLASQQANGLAQRFAELQAPAVERIAAGQAASMVLTAAGLDPKAPTSGPRSFVVHQEGASVRVEPLTAEQMAKITVRATIESTAAGGGGQAAGSQSAETGSAAKSPEAAEHKYPMLATFCAKCHGLDQAQPKGGIFLGDDDNTARWMRENFFAITQAVGTKQTMPPAGAAQPTREERVRLLNEVESIVSQRSGGGS
ncbi:MAG: hypothetical protein JNK76_25905 [Planctomycetales bacterium]|nr:hypothetical protein [Planctomycetales bacterium]